MSGTIPLSMTQQFDVYGKPLAGGSLYIIQVGTVSTPQNAYQDTGLTIALPYPIPLDAAGRVPQFFLADGYVKIRLQDKNGVAQLAADSVMVIGASTGGAPGGAPVDPTQLIQMGAMMFRYGIGTVAGYVRLNGLSIGGAGSGATEPGGLGSATQALFSHLYGADSTLILRDSSQAIVARTNAANDFANAKNLALPDFRDYALGALSGMGNSLAGRLTSAFAGLGAGGFNPDLLGAVAGSESYTQLAANMAQHDHTFYVRDKGHTHAGTASHNSTTNGTGAGNTSGGFVATTDQQNAYILTYNKITTSGTADIVAGSVSGAASSDNKTTQVPASPAAAHRTIGPRKLVTFYIKL